MFKAPYYFYIFVIEDMTEDGRYFGYNKYRIKLGFTRYVRERLKEWRRDLKRLLRNCGYPENALMIHDDYYEMPGVFFDEINGYYILIGKDGRDIQHFDQDVRNCLYEMEFTKRPNFDIKPLEKFGIDKIYSIEGLDLYDNKCYEDVRMFMENIFIPCIKNADNRFQNYFFTLTESEYIQFCETEVSKLDKDITRFNTKQLKEYIESNYGENIDERFLTIINLENNPYDDIEFVFEYIMSLNLSDILSKVLLKEYGKVNSNYQIRKCINKWLCIDKDYKNGEEEVALF